MGKTFVCLSAALLVFAPSFLNGGNRGFISNGSVNGFIITGSVTGFPDSTMLYLDDISNSTQGTIVAKDLRGDKLDEKLKELLK